MTSKLVSALAFLLLMLKMGSMMTDDEENRLFKAYAIRRKQEESFSVSTLARMTAEHPEVKELSRATIERILSANHHKGFDPDTRRSIIVVLDGSMDAFNALKEASIKLPITQDYARYTDHAGTRENTDSRDLSSLFSLETGLPLAWVDSGKEIDFSIALEEGSFENCQSYIESLGFSALDDREQALGKIYFYQKVITSHSKLKILYDDYADAFWDYAKYLGKKGRYSQQEKALLRARAICKISGEPHPYTVDLYREDLAKCYEKQGRFDEAEILFLQNIDQIEELSISKDQSDSLSDGFANYIHFLIRRGRFSAACGFQNRALELDIYKSTKPPHFEKRIMSKVAIGIIRLNRIESLMNSHTTIDEWVERFENQFGSKWRVAFNTFKKQPNTHEATMYFEFMDLISD